MTNIIRLLKLQIDNKFDFFKSDLKKVLKSVGKYILFMGLITAIGYVMSLKIFFLGFKSNVELISIVILITQLITFVFALGYIINNLFLSNENTLLMVLPVSPNQVFISKILVLYITELVINTFYTLPLLVIVGLSSLEVNITYYLLMPILLVLLPILPIAIAAMLSIPVMLLIRFLSKISLIWSALLFGAFWFSFSVYMRAIKIITLVFDSKAKQVLEIININEKVLALGKKNVFYYHLTTGLVKLDQSYWLLLFLLGSIVLFLLGMLIIKPTYFKVSMGNLEESIQKTFRKKRYKRQCVFFSLLMKEIKTVFRSPGYLFQYFTYIILMPIIVTEYDKLLIPFAQNSLGKPMVVSSHVLIISIMAMLGNIVSASAISREGGTFYLMKTTPVNYYVQTAAKLTFNIIFSVTMILITGFISVRYLEARYVTLITAVVIFASLGHLFLSYELDLKKPMLDWYDTEEISKVGSTTSKSIIYGLLISLFLGFMNFSSSNITKALITMLVISIIFCLYRLYILILRSAYCYEEIEV